MRAYVNAEAPWTLSAATVGECLAATVREHPDREAMVSRHQGIRQTWTEVAADVDRVAAGLLALGVGRGQRVGIWAPTRAEWTHLQFATAKLGAILVCINPAYQATELAYALNRAGVSVLVMTPGFRSSDYGAMLAGVRADVAGLSRVVTIDGDPAGGPDDLRWEDLVDHRLDRDELARREVQLDSDDPINIQFTSGTTGNPKGATLTHHNIVNNARAMAYNLGYSEHDRVCVPVPLYHCFGMVAGNLSCAAAGSTIVYPAESFDPGLCLEAIAEEGCTSVYGVPTMFIAQLSHPRFAEFDLSSLRTGIVGGAPCPVEVMKQIVNDMHLAEVSNAYGMTETSPASFMARRDDTLDRRAETAGSVLPHTEARIVEPATGATAAPGAVGEVCVRGYLVMRGYWDDPEATVAIIDESGWLHTGDLGTLDADGYLRIVGRIKEMIIRGGENVYPREVEEVLHQHPGIEAAQVFGIPDERMGEEVAAWVTARAGVQLDADELTAFCRERLARFKVPQHVKVVEAFPMTVTGKVQKFRMRQIATEELGRQHLASTISAAADEPVGGGH